MTEMTLQQADIHKGYQILVNREHPIQNNAYFTRKFLPIGIESSRIQLEKNTANLLNQLLDSISAKEKIVLVSGYRNQKEQEEIFQSSILENGIRFTEKYVALPNCSEHQTGLAIDLGERAENIDFIRPHFSYSGIAGKFRKKAAEFGFIERYGLDKEAVTGISHEPWHFRYVGYPHAQIMQEQQLCLEEYIAFIKDYTFGVKHYHYLKGNQKIEISFLKAESHPITIDIPDHCYYQVSGNNVDGFIITTWG
ncbi:D-alanyl-D-alanine carboxypeptidase family protein [Ornithinibacillus sp. JPR2-1]|uniref:D-alanyl-D-alanine carboxypeptidase family protein n=1 Tax=Ornithinibacillus sp. JPR2-1 TaxID=2094019 RepID=UPI0031DFCE95